MFWCIALLSILSHFSYFDSLFGLIKICHNSHFVFLFTIRTSRRKKSGNILSVRTALTGTVKERQREVQVRDPCLALAI